MTLLTTSTLCHVQEAFFGRDLLDKSSSTKMDNLDVASDDEKRNEIECADKAAPPVAAQGASGRKSKDPFEFADSPTPPSVPTTSAVSSASGRNCLQWSMTSEHLSSKESASAFPLVDGDGLQNEDDSDKEHHIGNSFFQSA